MKKTFCIKHSNLPTKLPLYSTAVMLLVLDYYHLPDLLRGICYTIWSVLWIIAVISIAVQKPVDVFESDKDSPKSAPETGEEARSNFQERLIKMAMERGYKVKDNHQ